MTDESFENLEGKTLWYKPSRGSDVLRGVSTGRLQLGSMCAIMGPTGAGKSTLLKILSGHLQETAGEVRVNGMRHKAVSADRWKWMASYIPQEDSLHGCLTPRQALAFQARLYGMHGKVADAAVTEVLAKMCLTSLGDTPIGDRRSPQRLSSGNRKRCSVALELLKRPAALFLEEGLAGLDALSALELVLTLHGLCVGEGERGPGRTADDVRMLVVWVLNQPSSKVFQLFDYLLLLRNGSVAFAGPSEEAEAYFVLLNPRVGHVPARTNPAEHFLEILQDEDSPPPAMVALPSQSQNSHTVKALWSVAAGCLALSPCHSCCSFCLQVWILLWRALLIRITDPAHYRDRVLIFVLCAATLGLFYWKVQDSQVNAADREALIFASLSLLTLTSLAGSALQFYHEKATVRWEYRNGIYGLAAWHVANVTASLLAQSAYTTLYVIVLYRMTGLRDDSHRFALFLFVCHLLGFIGVGIGIILGAVVGTLDVGTVLFPPIALPGLLFLCSSFMIRPMTVPTHMQWLCQSSFLEQAFRLLLTDQLKGFRFALCDPSGELCPLGSGRRKGDLWLEGMIGYPADQSQETAWAVLCSSLAIVLVLGLLATKLQCTYAPQAGAALS